MVFRARWCAVLLGVLLVAAPSAWAQPPAPEPPPLDESALAPSAAAPEPSASPSDTAYGDEAVPPSDRKAGILCEEPCGTGCGPCEYGCGSSESFYNPWTSPDVYRRGQFYVQSWLAQGFTWNPYNPESRFNAFLTFNDRANEYQMNQLYLSMGRRVNTERCGWDWGGRVDLLYGTDYFFTTATGLETHRDGSPRWNSEDGPRNAGYAALYGLAMPQLCAELYAPWGYGTSLKFGHFYSILGYESVMAPENFFYSHSYVKQYGEPFTHTGMLASYRWTPQTTIHGGLTRGWNTWEDPNDTLAFLGGVSWTSCDRRTGLAFALHSGNEDFFGENNRTSYSLVFRRQLTERFTYVFQHDFGIEADGALARGGGIPFLVGEQLEQLGGGLGDPVIPGLRVVDAYWYGINQYFLYAMTDTTSLGFRFEWFRDEEHARLLSGILNPFLQGGNIWAATVGLNWRPSPRLTVRPELRWDWSDTQGVDIGQFARGLYDDFQKKNRFTFAVDAILVF